MDHHRTSSEVDLVRIEEVQDAHATEWDDFVVRSPGWTPYHLYAWRKILEDVHHHRCLYLGARRATGELAGVLPVVRVRSRLFGHYLVSMPFLNYGGPLGSGPAIGALVEHLLKAADGGVDLVELRAHAPLPIGLPVSHRKITVLLDLPSDPEELWGGLASKVRSQVRRSSKQGYVVQFGSAEAAGFYSVFSRHMRDLGTPVQPKALFDRAAEEFGPAMWFGCVLAAGMPVAAGCGFRWEDRFELVWASALKEFSRAAPNMLLYWHFLQRSAEDGARVFDFGRCTPGGGTHRFKLQWGGRDVPLWWYQHGARNSTPSPDTGPFSIGPRVWRRLPLSVANALGPRIVRFLP